MDALKVILKVLCWLSLSGVVLLSAVSAYFSCESARLSKELSTRRETPHGKLIAEIIVLADEMREPYRPFLVRYCEYIAAHGYGDAAAALAEVDALEGEARREWLDKTYAQCVTNDDELFDVLSAKREARDSGATVIITGDNNVFNRSNGGVIVNTQSVTV